MANLPLNEPVGVLVKTTCVDFPGRVAGSFFLKGCNLRCPYCYNKSLVDFSADLSELSTINDLFAHLEKRQGILSGLVISGGEPLLNPYTPIIIKKAKELGYKIKLDTNGTLPEKLKEIVHSPDLHPDFIAMDVKTSPKLYSTKLCLKQSAHYDDEKYFETVLKESAEILKEYSSEDREIRTVLVPALVTRKEIEEIANIIPKDSVWQFAQFRNENCLDESFNEIYPYTDSEAKDLITYAQNFITNAALR